MFAFWVLCVATLAACNVVAPSKTFRFYTNQSFIEDIRGQEQKLEDVDEMFRLVFTNLPDTVKVYPTENYYYFKSYTNRGDIWGNLRLDSIDRDSGIVSFAYFYVNPNSSTPFYQSGPSWHKNFSSVDGVQVVKKERLVYLVTYLGKTVTFNLNDLEQVLPAGFRLSKFEEFAGRLCDESGMQFFLIYNKRHKAFYYILDETIALADIFYDYGKDIVLGQLSQFAFYVDELGRKQLFGVASRSVEANTYYDGPFDQLPDNFVNPERFQKLLEEAYPPLKGKVRGRGDFVDENGARVASRIAISPYLQYREPRDLWVHFVRCQKIAPNDREKFRVCLSTE